MSHIHGEEVDFHSDTHDAKKFLEHQENRHVAEAYFAQARKDGEAHFYADGEKFTIKHEKGENGEGTLSVHHHH